MKTLKLISGALLLSAIISGCSTHQKMEANLNEAPSWLKEENVGCSMLSASGLPADQKQKAVERAIISMMMKDGNMEGSSRVMLERTRHQNNAIDEYSIRYRDNGTYNIVYDKKEFQVEVINRWSDNYNGRYCVQTRRR